MTERIILFLTHGIAAIFFPAAHLKAALIVFVEALKFFVFLAVLLPCADRGELAVSRDCLRSMRVALEVFAASWEGHHFVRVSLDLQKTEGVLIGQLPQVRGRCVVVIELKRLKIR
ncbi:MAG: hypothetical protein A2103_00575 [Gammaproteobacteria bacterium GWF2_41_13]|nr:MAG: hypothetical protein A2103_00575 [Gammaproteobacteria bacterium GWF2_41_13]